MEKTLTMNIFKKILGFFSKPKKQPSLKNLGWKKDLPDPRDHKFKVSRPIELPKSVDLRKNCPPVYNQLELGSCTANALGAAYQFEQLKHNKPNFIPSRLFIYYNERKLEGTIDEDSGATIRSGIKTMVKQGVCPEHMWKYNITKFRKEPPKECYVEGEKNQILEYLRISPHSLYEVKHCLYLGYPISFGFMIFESMMSTEVTKTGHVPIPNKKEQSMGGHAVLAVGYDDDKKCLLVRNSWGTTWGINGYFWLPYEYVTVPNLSADYWTIRMVE